MEKNCVTFCLPFALDLKIDLKRKRLQLKQIGGEKRNAVDVRRAQSDEVHPLPRRRRPRRALGRRGGQGLEDARSA